MNNINTRTTEQSLVDEILSLRDELLREGVHRVFVGEILPRGDVSRSRDEYLTVDGYDERRKRINRALHKKLGRWCVFFFIKSAFRPTPLVNGIRVVSALGRFGLSRFGLGRFGQFWGWVVSALVGGSFRPIFWVSRFGPESFRPKYMEIFR